MINFFRKTRKKMADDNRPLKYMRYAIGEIVLVVVGILIAISINNWNEERKDQLNIDHYLTSLQESLNDDVENLTNMENVNLFRLRSINYLMHITGKKAIIDSETGSTLDSFTEKKSLSLSIIPQKYWSELENINDPELIDLAFTWASRPYIAQFNKQAIEELKNTGMFSMIEDSKLKNEINDYYLDLGWTYSELKEINISSESKEWSHYLMTEIGVLVEDVRFMNEPLKLLENPMTVIYLRNLGFSANGRLKNAVRLKKRALELIEKIEEEIGI